MKLDLKELNVNQIEEIKSFFVSVFMREPWNDDWSDGEQLHSYIMDLIGNPNSLVLGFYENGEMIGLSMGGIKHWYSGTEYYIDELCIKTEEQGHGLGTRFVKEIEAFLEKRGIRDIFLQTEREMPAYQFYQKKGFIALKDHVSFYKEW